MANSWAYNPLFQPMFISEQTINAAVLNASRRHSYVSFIWGETYARAALVLARGLRQVGTKLEFMVVIMTLVSDVNVISKTTMTELYNSRDIDQVFVIRAEETEDQDQNQNQNQNQKKDDWSWSFDVIKNHVKMKEQLQKYSTLLFSGVRGLGVPQSYDMRVFSKLLAFTLLEYDSIAVIDVDVVVVKNLDAALLVVGDDVRFASVGRGVFSSAFFVVHPDLEIMSELIQVVHECDSWRFPEQDLLNVYFGAGHSLGRQVHQRLPDEYLCMAETMEVEHHKLAGNKSEIEQSNCLLLEFASCGMKPWHLNALSTGGEGLCYPERRATNMWDAGIRRWQQLQKML